jgi:hypothetical protein
VERQGSPRPDHSQSNRIAKRGDCHRSVNDQRNRSYHRNRCHFSKKRQVLSERLEKRYSLARGRRKRSSTSGWRFARLARSLRMTGASCVGAGLTGRRPCGTSWRTCRRDVQPIRRDGMLSSRGHRITASAGITALKSTVPNICSAVNPVVSNSGMHSTGVSVADAVHLPALSRSACER